MCRYSDELLLQIWEKARIVDGYDSSFYRKDACGAWIIWQEYGNRNSPFGWEVDHIYPEAKLRSLCVPESLIDNIVNLRPLNWKNNDSKGADFPCYQATMKSEDRSNIEGEYQMSINDQVQKDVIELYKEYL